jgi:type IV pilus assembly protein PilA
VACSLQLAPLVPQSSQRRRAERAFTLVELMIVVAIIAILAVLALVGYKKMVSSSHTAEATHMVQAIRVAQESYRSETQQYDNISTDIVLGSLYPQPTPAGNTNSAGFGNMKTAWGGACSACSVPTAWAALPIHPDGPVYFGYATVAGSPGIAPSATPLKFQGQTLAWPSAAQILDNWYIISAIGDPDGDSNAGAYPAGFTTVVGTSWTNDLYIDEED